MEASVLVENDEGILFHVDQPASGSGSDERNDVRHARGKLKAYPMSHLTCSSTRLLLYVGDCLDGTLGLETL